LAEGGHNVPPSSFSALAANNKKKSDSLCKFIFMSYLSFKTFLSVLTYIQHILQLFELTFSEIHYVEIARFSQIVQSKDFY